MSPNSLLKAAPFRLALLYAGLFTLSALVLMAVVYVAITRLVEEQLRTTVASELQALQGEADRENLEELAQAIGTRRADPTTGAFAYLLQDPAGRRLAGELPPSPPTVGWRTIVLPEAEDAAEDDEGRERLVGKGAVLADGSFLLVAHDTRGLLELQELLLRGSLITIAFTLPIALGGGVVMSLLALRRIEAINRVSAQIRQGDLAKRVPRTGTDDELDRLAANINAMLDSIQHLTEGLRQVSSDIAHDLRTPLSRLRQELEAASGADTSPTDLRAAVEQAIAQTDAILETFGALLRIAQIEAGAGRSAFVCIDLSGLFRSLAEVYEPVAKDAGRHVEARIDKGIAFRGDRELLTQMLANLIENAIRHTPHGTRIDVALRRQDGRALAIIADNGSGIPEPARGQVFRRFFRLEASRSTPGSGLGLSLVAAVASLHAVGIELADNAPGLRVTLRFPMSATS